MAPKVYILFCENPLERNKVDPDFEEEFLNAKQNDFSIILFDFEELISTGNVRISKQANEPMEDVTNVIYRGWMLTPHQYVILYNHLLRRNYKLLNSPTEYQNCHYLSDSLRFIDAKTPATIFEKLEDSNSIDLLIEKAKTFENRPVIIKDFVKSEKHNWDTACFVSNAADAEKLRQTINNFIQLRDKYLNEGIVIREFVELTDLTIHSKSEMPLKEEYRLFFLDKKLIGVYDYWEEGDYLLSKPDVREFESIAGDVESNFFTMDIARKKDGELIIIELGDGQVSGLPDKADKNKFYENLARYCC